jgi:beta-phosphoglucomutase-like phosphatase (HAD superfamily)
MKTSAPSLSALGVDPAKAPVVTRDQLKYAKPDPDLFLAAAERLSAPIETAVVIGDSIWVDSLPEGGEFELPLRSKQRVTPG